MLDSRSVSITVLIGFYFPGFAGDEVPKYSLRNSPMFEALSISLILYTAYPIQGHGMPGANPRELGA